jgi:hypothetical protein
MARPELHKPGTKSIYVRGLDETTCNVISFFARFETRSQADVLAEAVRFWIEAQSRDLPEDNQRGEHARWCRDMHYARADKRRAAT